MSWNARKNVRAAQVLEVIRESPEESVRKLVGTFAMVCGGEIMKRGGEVAEGWKPVKKECPYCRQPLFINGSLEERGCYDGTCVKCNRLFIK